MAIGWKNYRFLFFLPIVLVVDAFATVGEQQCLGTSTGLSQTNISMSQRYNNLKGRLANCDVVIGNLELVQLGEDTHQRLDWTFLNQIQEVTGYVLIYDCTLDHLPLNGLRLIRGRQLHRGYSLYVGSSSFQQLGLRSLKEISQGSVYMHHVPKLCFVQTIDWRDIFNANSQIATIPQPTGATCTNSTCHTTCQKSGSGCWAKTVNDCQSFTRLNCSQQCTHRCQGKALLLSDCCHDECAAGCTGPSNTQCLGCRHSNNNGTCVRSCPPLQIYNPKTFRFENNPAGKYADDLYCVKACPGNRFTEGDKCVKSCSAGYNTANGSRECLPCAGSCPKTCSGTFNVGAGKIETLDRGILQQFVNCTHVLGNLVINSVSTQTQNPLQPEDLDMLQHIEEIDGYLSLDRVNSTLNVTSLDFLRNLRLIRGNQKRQTNLQSGPVYMALFSYINPNLKALRLRSLKEIGGPVLFFQSPRLCYVHTINWTLLTPSNVRAPIIHTVRQESGCVNDSFVCDKECDPAAGCWDKGPDQCIRCRHIEENGVCVASCNNTLRQHLVVNGTCMPCHQQCNGICTGLGADECTACRRFQDGPYCVESCPTEVKYVATNGTCLSCPPQCKGGCTGPKLVPRKGGCYACWLGTMSNGGTVGSCVPNVTSGVDLEDPRLCQHGTYLYRVPANSQSQWAGQYFCRPCHAQCNGCYGGSSLDCKSCVSLKSDQECVSACPAGTFQKTRTSCFPCHADCFSNCTGPTLADCILPTTRDTAATTSTITTTVRTTVVKISTKLPASSQTSQQGTSRPTQKTQSAATYHIATSQSAGNAPSTSLGASTTDQSEPTAVLTGFLSASAKSQNINTSAATTGYMTTTANTSGGSVASKTTMPEGQVTTSGGSVASKATTSESQVTTSGGSVANKATTPESQVTLSGGSVANKATTPESQVTFKLGTAALQTADTFNWLPVIIAVSVFFIFIFVMLYLRKRNRERQGLIASPVDDSDHLILSQETVALEKFELKNHTSQKFGPIPTFMHHGLVNDTKESNDRVRSSSRVSCQSDVSQDQPTPSESQAFLRSSTPESGSRKGSLTPLLMQAFRALENSPTGSDIKPARPENGQDGRSGSSLSTDRNGSSLSTDRNDRVTENVLGSFQMAAIPVERYTDKSSVPHQVEPVSLASPV